MDAAIRVPVRARAGRGRQEFLGGAVAVHARKGLIDPQPATARLGAEDTFDRIVEDRSIVALRAPQIRRDRFRSSQLPQLDYAERERDRQTGGRDCAMGERIAPPRFERVALADSHDDADSLRRNEAACENTNHAIDE